MSDVGEPRGKGASSQTGSSWASSGQTAASEQIQVDEWSFVAGTAAELFGERLDLAERYASLLRTTGIDHGLIGPREAERIWQRHILNCAVVKELVPAGASLADVGSGAGLPGLVLAIARPDVHVTLVEPLERRVRWLTTTVEELGLTNVRIERARAEDVTDRFDVVTARAVADLTTLVRWCLPLVTPGGRLLALKGSRAQEEVDRVVTKTPSLAGRIELVTCGVDVVEEPAAVVIVTPDPSGPHPPQPSRSRPHRTRRSSWR